MIASNQTARPAYLAARPYAAAVAMVVVQDMGGGIRQRFELGDVEVETLIARANRSGRAAPAFSRSILTAATMFQDPAVASVNFDPAVAGGVICIERGGR